LPASPAGMSDEQIIDSMRTFEARNIAATMGCHFSVEDLHEAFLLLGADVLVVQEPADDQIQSHGLEQQVSCHEDVQTGDVMPCLEEGQLDQQNRLQNQRNERMRLQLRAAALAEELRKVQSTLAESPASNASQQQCEAGSSDCNNARMVTVSVPPLPLGEPNAKTIDGSGMPPPSRASDPLVSLRSSSARHRCSSGSSDEHGIREADDIEPAVGEELRDPTVAYAQGTDNESHLSVQSREVTAVSTGERANTVQQRPNGDVTAASQT